MGGWGDGNGAVLHIRSSYRLSREEEEAEAAAAAAAAAVEAKAAHAIKLGEDQLLLMRQEQDAREEKALKRLRAEHAGLGFIFEEGEMEQKLLLGSQVDDELIDSLRSLASKEQQDRERQVSEAAQRAQNAQLMGAVYATPGFSVMCGAQEQEPFCDTFYCVGKVTPGSDANSKNVTDGLTIVAIQAVPLAGLSLEQVRTLLIAPAGSFSRISFEPGKEGSRGMGAKVERAGGKRRAFQVLVEHDCSLSRSDLALAPKQELKKRPTPAELGVVIARVGFSVQAQNGQLFIGNVTSGSDAFHKKMEPGTEVLALQGQQVTGLMCC